jgi:hypothetical protein
MSDHEAKEFKALMNVWFYEQEVIKKTLGKEIEDFLKEVSCKTTANVYENRLAHLMSSPFWPFDKSEKLLKLYIESCCPTLRINTLKNVCNNLLKFASVSQGFKQDMGDDNWNILNKLSNNAKAQSKINRSKPRVNDVSWDFLLDLGKNLPDRKSDEILIYKLYVAPGINLMPRNDFSNMKIVDTMDDTKDTSFNYFVKDAKIMIFNEFKNSKWHNNFIRDVPDDIISNINQAQKFLFEYRGERLVENSLSKKINATFKKLTDNKNNITINTIRRAYANQQPKGDSISEIIDLAENSMHTAETHLEYMQDKN